MDMSGGGGEVEDFMQPVSQLADELRSETTGARVEAMKRLSTIALALGQERTRRELIPFLQSSLNDDDEVLLAMADELGGMVEYVGGGEHASLLLGPLEGLACADETVVRDAAMVSLGKIISVMSDEQVSVHLVPMAKRLSTGDWFPQKSSAATLIGLISARLPAQDQATLRSILATLSHDETSIVRKAVLNNLAKVIRAMSGEEDYEALNGMLSRLAGDTLDAVRLLSVVPLAAFGEHLKQHSPTQISLFETIFQSLASDRSWRIRYMLAKHFAPLCLVQPSTLKAFCALLKDAEPEVRTAAAGELVHVARVVPPEEVRLLLLPLLPALCTDPSTPVKAALALSLHDLSPLVGPQATIDHVLPLIIKLLGDEASEVRLNVVKKFEQTVQVIGIDMLHSLLLPAIARLSQDGQWRVREIIISLIPTLARLLGHERFEQSLADICLGLLDDPVGEVRRAAAHSHALIIKSFGTQWALDSGLIDKLLQLALHPNYLRRQACLLLLAHLITLVSVDYVTIGFLLPVLEAVKADPVVNVRIFLAAHLLTPIIPVLVGERPDILRDTCLPILQQLAIDPDQDVREAAHRALALVPSI